MRPPLQLNLDPQLKINFRHVVLNHFFWKSPQHKNSEGEGLLMPPGSYRVKEGCIAVNLKFYVHIIPDHTAKLNNGVIHKRYQLRAFMCLQLFLLVSQFTLYAIHHDLHPTFSRINTNRRHSVLKLDHSTQNMYIIYSVI